MNTNDKIVRRLRKSATPVILIMAFFSLGPAPGEVGGCGESIGFADPVEHCINQGAVICQRQQARGEIDADGLATCQAAVLDDCPGTTWPGACAPTDREATACIDSLRFNVGRADSTPAEIEANFPACDLCGGATGGLYEGEDDWNEWQDEISEEDVWEGEAP